LSLVKETQSSYVAHFLHLHTFLIVPEFPSFAHTSRMIYGEVLGGEIYHRWGPRFAYRFTY